MELPPGVARMGTEYAVEGRYYDADLLRWHQGAIQPIGGWRDISTTTVSGSARAITTWVDNSNQIWAGIGTHSGLFVMTQTGVVTDITPSGFTTGRADAVFGGGFGSGDYGDGTYGTARADVSVLNNASMWTLDVFDEFLVGCMPEDGIIYDWDLNTSNDAVAVTNAPTGCAAVFVTNDLFVMALGAGGDPRRIDWSSRGNRTVWTPAATNTAGSVQLQTNGKIRCGKRFIGGELIFTSVDVHLARYVGQPDIYVFDRLAGGCGIISPQAAAVVGSQAFWMSDNNFWMYNGFVQPMPCDVYDYVFTGMNEAQRSKTYAVHNSAFGEVWWFYPRGESNECDSYVIYNYLNNFWNIGSLSRTCGTNQDVFGKPLLIDAAGQVYEHEIGQLRDGRQSTARSAPLAVGNGENFVYAREYDPDEQTAGDSTVKFFTKYRANGAEYTHGPYTSASPKTVRFSGNLVAWEWAFESGKDARIGIPRLKISMGGRR